MIRPGSSLSIGWSALVARIVPLVGAPCSLVFRLVTGFRNSLFDVRLLRSAAAALPVISVGNLTVGGNGKTPTVIWLASELVKLGFKPVILSRGYGGSSSGPQIVDGCAGDGPAHASLVGDEPLMMARRGICPVVIAKRRVAGASLIARHRLGDVILLDDGFQHRWLARDLDLVVANIGSEGARAAFAAGRMLPVGRFRESRERALRRAGAIIFIDRVAATDSQDNSENPVLDLPLTLRGCIPSNLPFFNAKFIPRRIVEVGTGSEASTAKLAGQQVVALCALGQPEAFFATLEELGATVVARQSLRDHAVIPPSMLEALRLEFPGALVICTEKDAVKLLPHHGRNLWYLEIDIMITHPERLLSSVVNAIDRKWRLGARIAD